MELAAAIPRAEMRTRARCRLCRRREAFRVRIGKFSQVRRADQRGRSTGWSIQCRHGTGSGNRRSAHRASACRQDPFYGIRRAGRQA